MTPWLAGATAVVVVSVLMLSSGHIIAGLFKRRPVAWDTEFLHLGMGLAMAGMLNARLAVLPTPVWLTTFAAGGSWFVWRTAVAVRHTLTRYVVGSGLVHIGGCAAMAYMLLVAPANPSMPDMAGLICGARMLGMQVSGSGDGFRGPFLAFTALALGSVLVVGAAASLYSAFARARHATERVMGTVPAANGTPGSRAVIVGRLGMGAQIAMCLVMTSMLVAMYR